MTVQTSSSQLLTTSIEKAGDVLVLTCHGAAETEALDLLQQVLTGLHEEVLRNPVQKVVVDIRRLEFASSSCLKTFVMWLQRVQELEDTRRYHVVFRSNPQHSWQRRSLGALAAFAAGVVEIESEVR